MAAAHVSDSIEQSRAEELVLEALGKTRSRATAPHAAATGRLMRRD
ncbi:MAG: hypothetical protein IPI67_01980 [Myxococcales bacterium]|nr:hypothetical protein [Myxococcales bacterium]